jgi:hypothetical protein
MENGFSARSRNQPQSPHPRGQGRTAPSLVIIGSQSSTARHTYLLGSVDGRQPSAPARVRIMHVE